METQRKRRPDQAKRHGRKRRKRKRQILLRLSLCLFVIFAVLNLMNFTVLPWPVSHGELSDYLDDLYSPNAVLADAETGQILGSRNGNRKVYPASLTKIMTALTALEHIQSLDAAVTIPQDIYQDLYQEDASMAGFEAGETVTYRDLIYGALLPSGAECCLTLAVSVAGGEDDFVTLMNAKARELGMKRTHFTNCTGLQNSRHYSTAEDISKLLVYALQNPTFRQAFTSSSYTSSPTSLHPDGLTFTSTLPQSLPDPSVTGGKILGGKTGYTKDAGLCLASLAEINGREYILVTTGAPGDHQTEPYHVQDAIKVYGRIGSA